MVPLRPPIACGYGGRLKNTTLEEFWPTKGRNTNITGGTTHVATNLNTYFASGTHKKDKDSSKNKQDHGRHRYQYATARDRHSRRGSRWADSESTRQFCAQSAQFDTGTKAFCKRSSPTVSEIMSRIQKDSRRSQMRNNRLQLLMTAYQIAQHEHSATSQIREQVDKFWRKPAYGKAPRTKPDDCVRIIMENFNSLGIFTNSTKINALNKLCREFKADILAGCETQADWRQATEEQQFKNVIGVGTETRSIVAHNINERMQRNQHGGCAMMAMGRLSAEVVETGADPYGLGRWCWMKVGSGEKKTQIVMIYQPSGTSTTNSAGTTVREQHERYFEARGDLRPARIIFFDQLIAQLIVWKSTDSDIILLGDFNKNVYTGRIAKRLAQPDLNFNEQCHQCTGVYIPPTFREGTIPIDAVYATAGIECVSAHILPHKGGVGDHRCFIVDFSSTSVIGSKFPNIVRCVARRLHCKSTRLVQTYNQELDHLCTKHKMYERIYFIYSHIEHLSEDDFSYLMNKWDTKLIQFKLHSEKECTKYKSNQIEWSPEVGFWLSRRWLLVRVKKFVLGLGPPDSRNLVQDCLRSHLFDPRMISHSEVMIHIQITQRQLWKLAKDGPEL